MSAGAVLKADEILVNEQLSSRHLFDPIEIDGFGTVPIQRYLPAKIDGRGFPVRAPAPSLDEHADEILREAGLSVAEVAVLRQGDVIVADTTLLGSAAMREARWQPYDIYLEMGSVHRIDAEHRQVCARAIEEP